MTGLRPSSAAPLAGTSVVLTRTRAQASELSDRLIRLGATVVELPVIAIEDPVDGGAALQHACRQLAAGRFDWVACTSVNSVSRVVAALGTRAVPPSVRWAAVGAGTARALTAGGHPPDLVPTVSISDALAEAFPTFEPATTAEEGSAAGLGGKVLFPRAEAARAALADGLRAKGWSVEEVVAYRTAAGTPDPGAADAAARSGVIVFTSSSTVLRTVDLLGPSRVPPVVVTIGPITSDAARHAGLTVAREASPHTLAGVIEAVVAAASVRPTGAGPRGDQ